MTWIWENVLGTLPRPGAPLIQTSEHLFIILERVIQFSTNKTLFLTLDQPIDGWIFIFHWVKLIFTVFAILIVHRLVNGSVYCSIFRFVGHDKQMVREFHIFPFQTMANRILHSLFFVRVFRLYDFADSLCAMHLCHLWCTFFKTNAIWWRHRM